MILTSLFIRLPEIEFDNWDPGILTGCEEFCNSPDKSSKLAVSETRFIRISIFFTVLLYIKCKIILEFLMK